MRWAGLGLAGMMIVGLIGCNPKGSQSIESTGRFDSSTQAIAKSKQSETPPDSPVLIVTVQSRDHSVKIYSGDRYTVANTEGQLVAELVTEDEFKLLLPEVFDHVNEALAEDAWAGHSIRDDRSLPPIEQNPTIEIIQAATPTTEP